MNKETINRLNEARQEPNYTPAKWALRALLAVSFALMVIGVLGCLILKG